VLFRAANITTKTPVSSINQTIFFLCTVKTSIRQNG